ncbi:winged helix DNA-binding domain-containing protein [Paeniglutamicibacter cryotolerans]|uniref:winged helix DNA-binding domain-containing protein n=1 Tax=Paeniglutamicibacter cryotolerans TaxID=670079 RepID=UPI00160BCF95|nr:winged helix DNA-binding domain-containing protein [Paeniglutamicibacter cryotolerans]
MLKRTEQTGHDAVARLRLRAQGLLPDPGNPPDPAAVVRRLGMMQAQDLAQAFWALGVRIPGSTAGTVRAALDRGLVVRTWGARGTLMLLAPETVRPLLSITAPRMRAQSAATHRRENITEAELAALLPLALAACAPAGASRARLMEVFAEAGHDVAAQRGYHLLVALCLSGELVQGPMEPGSNTRQLFVGSSTWLPRGTSVADNRAPDALPGWGLLYFQGHGPATVADCAWWLGLPLTPVRAALATLEGQLGERVLDGQRYLFDPGSEDAWEEPPGGDSVLVLPGFDEFLLGYKDRTATLPTEHADAVTPGGNGVFRRTLTVGGQTIGTCQPPAGRVQDGAVLPFARHPSARLERLALARIRAYGTFRDS